MRQKPRTLAQIALLDAGQQVDQILSAALASAACVATAAV